jgi:hypothetical protein
MRWLALAAIAAAALVATDAIAADKIRLAVQRTGTLAWELDIIKAHGLDRKFDLAIERLELASTAGQQDCAQGRIGRSGCYQLVVVARSAHSGTSWSSTPPPPRSAP